MRNDNNAMKPGKDKISLSELYEVRDLSKRFTIAKKELKTAILEIWKNGRDYELLFQRPSGKPLLPGFPA
jgi:hypothetical protein